MAIVIENVSFSFGAAEILSNISLTINDGDKIGIVGDNGSGKTTLLKLLLGQYEPAAGTIGVPSAARIGVIEQAAALHDEYSVMEEMKSVLGADKLLLEMKKLEKTMGTDAGLISKYDEACAKYAAIDGYNLEFRIKQVLAGLGFGEEYYSRKVSVLSGGEKTKICMAKLLVSEPDLLILDEPTNHLDLASCEWLKQFLHDFKRSVLAVSHDGAFLDSFTTRILEISNHRGLIFSGNYSAYRKQREEMNELAEKEWREKKEKAEKLEDYIARNLERASTSNMAKSRRKQLEKMDLTPPESRLHERVFFRFAETPPPYKELLKTKSLVVGAGGKRLFKCADLLLLRGQNLAVMGGNGTGKTTFLRTMMRKNPTVEGSVTLGPGVKLSYYEQNVFVSESRDAMSVVRDKYPAMNNTEIRTLLASAGLRGDEVFVRVDKLSGGERARLKMCMISLEKPNVILLDEPTNHLDIYTKQTLTDALASFSGTIIAVSHDPEFIESLGCRILYVEGGEAEIYESFSLWKNREKHSGAEGGLKNEERPKARSQKDERREKAAERLRRSELENRVTELENQVSECEQKINDPVVSTDPEKLTKALEQLKSLKSELDAAVEQWIALDE